MLQDLPPFVTAAGNPAAPHGINSEGLKRRGFSLAAIESLRRAYKTLYRSGMTLEQARNTLAAQADECPEIAALLEFLARASRGIIR
jgi:UDP-N-acetylglucosamine acyltransferase